MTFHQPFFKEMAQKGGFPMHEGPRGAAENVGTELKATHPVVRTNPVTGWKSIFAVGPAAERINGVTDEESKRLLDWFLDLVWRNHDLQVRLRWKNKNDIGKMGCKNLDGPHWRLPHITDNALILCLNSYLGQPQCFPHGYV